MKTLTKSLYTAYQQCPRNLWLKINKPEEAAVDASVQARFEQGNEVGSLARKLFGEYVDVTTYKEGGGLDLEAMAERTKQEMGKGTETICEAAFTHIVKGCFERVSLPPDKPWLSPYSIPCYCAVDILRKDGDGWAIYEVKSTSFPEFDGQTAKLERYASNIAFQKWVMEKCGVKVTKTCLVCLNSNYVRHGELDLQKLFVCVDVGELVESEYKHVKRNVYKAHHLFEKSIEPNIDLSERCHKPYGCVFFNYCKCQKGVPKALPKWQTLIHNSFLSEDMKKAYEELIVSRLDRLQK